ncbi:MAG: tRNA pseudouridine(38-40) synthase TruA [Oscillospiraceae bacterium]|nr:tRNA pseudouridine(38-40) synthase TruA [Oscillospiraceae bacterium]
MRNLLFKISFNGYNYHGFFIQKKFKTVCGEICRTFKTIVKHNITIIGCSRTDSGVHANEYYFNTYINSNIPIDRFLFVLNKAISKDIVFLSCIEVELKFHARYDSIGKEYLYKINISDKINPFYNGLVFNYGKEIDIEILENCKQYFIGKHNFKAFCNINNNKIENTIREIYDMEFEKHKNNINIYIRGDGFLYNMVRIIIGTLLDINEKKISIKDLKDIILSKDRRRSGRTLYGGGLYLNKVFYTNKDVLK